MGYESSGKQIKIVYFSGTGGAARAADCVRQSLETRGCQIAVESLDKSKSNVADGIENSVNESCDILIVIYAVHAFDAPEPVYDWIGGLSQTKGISAAVISVSGGGEAWPNTASRAGCIKALEHKGYDVFYERMLVMPSNIFVDTNDHLAMHLLKCLPVKTEHCASEILGGIRRRKQPPVSARIVSSMLKIEKLGVRRFGRRLSASEACNACGWCGKNCPRRNISMANDRPEFGGQCIACLRCIYGCPKSAIKPGPFRFFTVKKGYDLEKLEARMAGIELEPVEKLAKGAFASLLSYLQHDEV